MNATMQTAPMNHGPGRPDRNATDNATDEQSATQHEGRVLQAALVAALATPATVEQAGARLGLPPEAVLPHLLQLIRQGCLYRHGPHRFAAVHERDASGCSARLPLRPQPIRDAILAYLAEPRQAKEIATHIGRPVANATGHLAAMGRLGMVVRTGYGRYARADLLAEGTSPAVIVRPHPVRAMMLNCLKEPMHVDAVAVATGRRRAYARDALQQLARDGLAVHLGRGVYAPARTTSWAEAGADGSVRAAAGDAVAANGKDVPCTL